jgi:hypothetical protein
MSEKYQTYLFEYYHENSWWTLEVPAASEQDALDRIQKLPLAKLLGTVQMKVPKQYGIFARLICWYRNRAVSLR